MPDNVCVFSYERRLSLTVKLQSRAAMACADADMRITGDGQDLWEAGRSEKPIMKYYQASEMLPSKKGPIDDLLQKQPAVLGVSSTC